MVIHKEYNDYLKFVENNYPNSSLNRVTEKNKFRIIIINSLKVIRLLDLYFHNDQIKEDLKELTDDVKMQCIRLIYALPINDYFFIDTVIRSISENILRVVYQIAFPENNIESTKKYNHRTLWDNGIKTSELFDSHKEALSGINRIFGNKSLTVHSYSRHYDNQVNYLIDLMINETQISIKQLNSDIRTIYEFLINDLFILLELDKEEMTLSQSLSLKELI